eukprot:COSAG02_NODE_2030_length_10067_cov_22.885333_12_plen_59_part_00
MAVAQWEFGQRLHTTDSVMLTSSYAIFLLTGLVVRRWAPSRAAVDAKRNCNPAAVRVI